jgi:hypothetical protein
MDVWKRSVPRVSAAVGGAPSPRCRRSLRGKGARILRAGVSDHVSNGAVSRGPAVVTGGLDGDHAFGDGGPGPPETFDTAKLLFHQKWVSELTGRNQLLSVGQFASFAEAGFLMTYGPDLNDLTRRAATCVDKILRAVRVETFP